MPLTTQPLAIAAQESVLSTQTATDPEGSAAEVSAPIDRSPLKGRAEQHAPRAATQGWLAVELSPTAAFSMPQLTPKGGLP